MDSDTKAVSRRIGISAKSTIEIQGQTTIVFKSNEEEVNSSSNEEEVNSSSNEEEVNSSSNEEEINSSSNIVHPSIRKAIKSKRSDFKKGIEIIPRPSIWFDVRDPISSFCGRQDFLCDLHAKIQETQAQAHDNGLTILSQFKVVTGLGGIGKTETARMYIHKYSQFYDRNVVWINAESDNTMRDSFLNLAEQKLGIPTKQENGRPIMFKEILQSVYNQLCQQKLLLIFDNAEGGLAGNFNSNCNLKHFLPSAAVSVQVKPFILVTSRDHEWTFLDSKITIVPLPVFTPDESTTFILNQLDLKPTESNKQEALLLGELLGHLPLSLQQAVAYIREEIKEDKENLSKKFTIQDYITQYDIQSSQSKFLKCSPFDSDPKTEMTVYTTWNVTFNKIQHMEYGECAIKLIETLAFLSPENIPCNLICNLLKQTFTEDQVSEGFFLLERYAMIQNYAAPTSNGSRRLSIHRQVQRVIVNNLKEKDQICRSLDTLISSSDPLLANMKPAEESYKHVLANMVSLVSHIKLIEEPSERIPKLEFQQDVAIRLSRVGNSYMASQLIQQVYNYFKTELGQHHLDTITALSIQAQIHLDQGEFEQALQVHQQVYEIRLQEFGQQHSLVMTTLGNIGSVLDELGRHEEAIEKLEQQYNFRMDKIGPDDYLTLNTKHNLVIALTNNGEHDRALQIGNELCEQRKRVLGMENEDTLSSLNLMAIIHYDLNQLTQAMEFYNEIYQTQLSILGQEHPQTLRTICNKSVILLYQEHYLEAQSVFQELLERFSSTLGSQHPNTLDIQLNLAIALKHNGVYDKSLALYVDVFDKFSKILDPQHEKICFSQDGIAFTSNKLGDLETAEKNWNQVYKWRLNKLGQKHAETWRVQEHLATICFSIEGRIDEGLKVFKTIYEAQLDSLGPNHKDTIRTLNNITLCLSKNENIAIDLYKNENFDEALEIFQKVYDMRCQLFGFDDPSTISSLQNAVCILYQKQLYERAINLLRTSFEILQEKLGIMNENTTEIYHMLASFMVEAGKFEELQTLYENVMNLQEKIVENQVEAISTKHNLGTLKKKMGQVEQALTLYNQVADSRREILGINHRDTIYIEHEIARVLKKLKKFDQALDLMRKVETAADKVYGTDDDFTWMTRHYLVAILRCNEMDSEAFDLAQRVLEKEIVNFGDDHPNTLSTQLNLARLLDKRGNFQEAQQLFQLVYDKRQIVLGQTHVKTIRAKELLDTFLSKQTTASAT